VISSGKQLLKPGHDSFSIKIRRDTIENIIEPFTGMRVFLF